MQTNNPISGVHQTVWPKNKTESGEKKTKEKKTLEKQTEHIKHKRSDKSFVELSAKNKIKFIAEENHFLFGLFMVNWCGNLASCMSNVADFHLRLM